METHFWHERWHRREIGFHRSEIHWALKRHWDEISGGRAGRVMVPLCGKSLDLRWLAERGHGVVGVELSGRAVEEFYREWKKAPTCTRSGRLQHWRAGNVEIFEGDFFDYLNDEPFQLFYDRAALVALPQEMRGRYIDHLGSLLADNASGLLVTFEYDQASMDGPPFSVPADELGDYPGFRFELIERRDALADHPGFAQRGLTDLQECAWRVTPV
jgi:thiopurine S-methyltransferase